MNPIQLQREAARLVRAHPHLIGPSSSWKTSASNVWRKTQAERRFKQRHFFALESERWHVAELCIKHARKVLDISRSALLGKCRLRRIADCRHIAMTVAYELSGLSTIKLGKLFNRGHTMFGWAHRRVTVTRGLRAQADKVVKAVKKELRQT